MRFIGRLVAKICSDFLVEVLMQVPDDTELPVVAVAVGSTGFVAQTKVVAVLRKLKGRRVLGSARRTRLRRHVKMEPMRSATRFIVAASGGLKDMVEDGLIDLSTDGKVTVEALVEQESLRKKQ